MMLFVHIIAIFIEVLNSRFAGISLLKKYKYISNSICLKFNYILSQIENKTKSKAIFFFVLTSNV